MTHSFAEQLKRGDVGEEALDRHFAQYGELVHVNMDDQRRGIDRYLIGYPGAASPAVALEYKTDYLAHKTGQVYLETLSSSTSGKLGWVHTSLADWLVYFIPGLDVAYVAPPIKWLSLLVSGTFRVVRVQNRGWYGEGALCPIETLKERLGAYAVDMTGHGIVVDKPSTLFQELDAGDNA